MSLISQTTTYTTPGTYTYTIPQGVSALEFFLWGAGGAHGSSGESVSRQTGTQQVGSIQTGTQVVGTVVVDAGVAAGSYMLSKELIVPPGVTSVKVTAAGGGGGGGGPDGGDENNWTFGAGGLAGQIAVQTIPVVEGQKITATVGTGGAGGGDFRTGGTGKPTTVAVNGTPLVTAVGGGGGAGKAVGAFSPGQSSALGIGGSGGNGSTTGYRGVGSSGQSGGVLIEWAAVPEVTADVIAPVYTPVYEPVYTSYPGGIGSAGGAGGYSNRKIRVAHGDVVIISVGGAGTKYAGGVGLTTPTNFSGGNAGVSSGTGRGGGGGAATVVTVNGVIVAVAAGGGGGGGGGTFGVVGGVGTGAGISGGTGGTSVGASSTTGPSTGGGGGGGFFGGLAGSSGSSGGGGNGGISYGTIIQTGTTVPGGMAVSLYPSGNPGYPATNGAAVLVFTKSFNINIKKISNWKSIDRAWVKSNGIWKELMNGWTKVSGVWVPLISAKSIEGADNLAAPAKTYLLTADVSSVDEGDTVSFTLSGTGLTSGEVVSYTATGIDIGALTSGALSGNFVVGTTDTITFTPKINHITYGARTLNVFLDNKASSASCIINNISLTPSYGISANVASLNEGEAVRFTLSNFNGVAGESINYSITGISSSRLTSGSLNGTFVVGSAETTDLAVSNDLTTTGTTVMTIKLIGKGATAACTVIDTSTTPHGSITGTPSGTTWTVPTGVYSAVVNAIGGGGGGGGCDSHAGYNGFPGDKITGVVSVTPGQVYTLYSGTGGGAGVSDQDSAPGGAGGTGYASGGHGSAAGPTPYSGGGGGGGAASALVLGGTPILVAAGGGGGGGGGNGSTGQGQHISRYASSSAGSNGTAKGGDGGGAGGGGGGYPLGGLGGAVVGGDNGGYSGTNGQRVLPNGCGVATANNGGGAAVRSSVASVAGGNGSITLTW